VSNFTRAGVKGGELSLGHEPPKVRLGSPLARAEMRFASDLLWYIVLDKVQGD